MKLYNIMVEKKQRKIIPKTTKKGTKTEGERNDKKKKHP